MADPKQREHAYDRQWTIDKIDTLALGPADHNAREVGALLAVELAQLSDDTTSPDRVRAKAALLAMASHGCAQLANQRFRALGSLIGRWASGSHTKLPQMLSVRTRDKSGAPTGVQSHQPVLQLNFGMLSMKYDEIEATWRGLGNDMAFIRNLLSWEKKFPQADCPMDVINHFNLDYQDIDFESVSGMSW